LDGAWVGELCYSSPASQADEITPFPTVSFNLLSVSPLVCGTLSTHPVVNNELSLLAANSVPLIQLSSREQQQ